MMLVNINNLQAMTHPFPCHMTNKTQVESTEYLIDLNLVKFFGPFVEKLFPDPDHITYFKINPGLYIKRNKTGAQTVPPVDTNENKPCQKNKKERKTCQT